VEGTVDDPLKDLEEQMPFFLEHVFAKRRQARFFDDKTEHLTKDQVSLFTVAIWTKNKGENTCGSYVIDSDELRHDKKSVAVFT